MAIYQNNNNVIVITINYNHCKDTIACVDSINNSIYDNFKIIIIDNGSKKEDYMLLFNNYKNNVDIKIIRLEDNIGYVGGVNKGLEEASKFNPDYFLIMNNDTIIDEKAISELVKTANKYYGNAIVSGKVYNMDEPETLQYIGQYTFNEKKLNFKPYIKNGREKDLGKYDKEMELGMADDIFWLLPLEIYNDVGGYSNYFFLYGEQNDYALRVKKRGYKLVYTPKAKLWHIEHLTTGKGERDSLKVKYWQFYSSYLLFYLHLPPALFLIKYLNDLLKVNIKQVLQLFRIVHFDNIEPKFYAFWIFTLWLFNKRKNNGYNPYN